MLPLPTRYPFKNRVYFITPAVVLPAFAMVILVWTTQTLRTQHIVLPFFITSLCMITAVAWFAVALPLFTTKLKDRARAAHFLICPACGYDLSKQDTVHTCPECGLQADQSKLEAIWTGRHAA